MATIVAALGGSLLRPEIEMRQIWLTELIDIIGKVVNNGTKIGLVVGGGSPARESIDLVKPLISDVGALDKIGIAATRLNATIIKEVLIEAGISTCSTVPDSIEVAVNLMMDFDVVVMGGTQPGHTTDNVAIKLAVATNSSKCIIATNVSKVYDKDPRKSSDARSFDSLSLVDLQNIVGPPEHSRAGDSQVVDPIGVECAIVNKMELNILDGRKINNLKNSMEGSNFEGTIVSW